MVTKNLGLTFDEFRQGLQDKFTSLEKGPFPRCPLCDTVGWTCPGFKGDTFL